MVQLELTEGIEGVLDGSLTFPSSQTLAEFLKKNNQKVRFANPEIHDETSQDSTLYSPWEYFELDRAISFGQPIFFTSLQAYREWRTTKAKDLQNVDGKIYLKARGYDFALGPNSTNILPLAILAKELGIDCLLNPEIQQNTEGKNPLYIPWRLEDELFEAVHYGEPIAFTSLEAYQAWRAEKIKDIKMEGTAVYLDSFIPASLVLSHFKVRNIYHPYDGLISSGEGETDLFSVQDMPQLAFDLERFHMRFREPSFFLDLQDAQIHMANYNLGRGVQSLEEPGVQKGFIQINGRRVPVKEGYGGDEKVTSGGVSDTMITHAVRTPDNEHPFDSLTTLSDLLPPFEKTLETERHVDIVTKVIKGLRSIGLPVAPVLRAEGKTYQTLYVGDVSLQEYLRFMGKTEDTYKDLNTKANFDMISECLFQTAFIDANLGRTRTGYNEGEILTAADREFFTFRAYDKVSQFFHKQNFSELDNSIRQETEENFDTYNMIRRLGIVDSQEQQRFFNAYRNTLGNLKSQLLPVFGRWTSDRYAPNFRLTLSLDPDSHQTRIEEITNVDLETLSYDLAQKELNLMLYNPDYGFDKEAQWKLRTRFAIWHGCTTLEDFDAFMLGEDVSQPEIQTVYIRNILNGALKSKDRKHVIAEIREASYRRDVVMSSFDSLRQSFLEEGRQDLVGDLDYVRTSVNDFYSGLFAPTIEYANSLMN